MVYNLGGDFSGLQSMTSKWPEVFAVWERYRLCGLVIMNLGEDHPKR